MTSITFRLAKLWITLGLVLVLAPSLTFAQGYIQTNLVTDPNSGATAVNTDKNLKNPWGLARSTGSVWWVSDNNAGISTLYDGTGALQSLVVTIPGPNGSAPNFVSAPTGVVFNGSTDLISLLEIRQLPQNSFL
jgi:hypothetical protein